MTVACATLRRRCVAIPYAFSTAGLTPSVAARLSTTCGPATRRAMSTSRPATTSTPRHDEPAAGLHERLAAPATGEEDGQGQQPQREHRQHDGEALQRGDEVLHRADLVAREDLDAPGAGRDLLRDRLREAEARDDVQDDHAQVEDHRVP